MENAKPDRASPFIPMFEHFRAELDEHHDRRERVIKASRDITAASKKIIFALQRVRKLGRPVPQSILKTTVQHYETIKTQYASVSKDLQSINAFRYSRNITGGNQEFMEATVLQHYLTSQTLISYDEACDQLTELGGQDGPIPLTPDDYILGVFDMVGELMRFAVTAMATNGALPEIKRHEERKPQHSSMTSENDAMDVDPKPESTRSSRTVLSDLRELRACLEQLEATPGSLFARDVDKKMGVMRACVEKVEKGLYGLIVRGSERPKGWVPDLREEDRREEIESF